MGALPVLYAAVAEAVRGGDYIGPRGPLGAWGSPRAARSAPRSYDEALARRLWEVSERATSVCYDLG